jgi:hypothetical protein
LAEPICGWDCNEFSRTKEEDEAIATSAMHKGVAKKRAAVKTSGPFALFALLVLRVGN